MKPVIVHDGATAELDEAIEFYEREQPGLGLALLLEVERVTKVIERHPQIGSPYKSSSFRKYVLGRFPHIIFYLELTKRFGLPRLLIASGSPTIGKTEQ